MLVQFSVENFLSFDKEQIFSMVAAKSDTQHSAHLVDGDDSKGGALLRAAALYGPNASGKSNLVQTLRYAQKLIVEGVRSERPLGVRPFRLRINQEGRLSKFEFVVRTQGNLYNYGFRLDNRRVHEEWLYATFNKQEVFLFERITSENGSVKVSFGASLKGKGARQKQRLEFIAEGMQPNQLFLTEAHERNIAEVKPLMNWFQNDLVIISADPQAKYLEIEVQRDKVLTQFLSDVLLSAGTGVQSVETEEVPFNVERFLSDRLNEEREEVRALLHESEENNRVVHILDLEGGIYFLRQKPGGEVVRILLRMQHQGADGQKASFTINEESEGTQRLIHLVPALHALKSYSEKTIVLDELDRRFHTHLSRMFLQIALDRDEQHQNSQLIFTTHDTNLLDLDLLRRDEIWFVEKDKQGASHLYGLSEFNVRPDLKIEKGYLNGRFGAIPFISDIGQLGWMQNGHVPNAAEPELEETAGRLA